MIFNVFRILGDLAETASKLFLIWAIHWNRSAEVLQPRAALCVFRANLNRQGVSLITQVLYAIVFCTRYLDLFWSPWFTKFIYIWLFTLKVFYISSSLYIVFLMVRVYARTREREKAWKFGIYCFACSAVLALPICAIFKGGPVIGVDSDGEEVLMWQHPWEFSEVCAPFKKSHLGACVSDHWRARSLTFSP